MRLSILNCVTTLVISATALSSPVQFTPVKIRGTEGVIVPEAFLRESGLPADGFWTPTISQLREAERSLPAFLRKERRSRPTIREISEAQRFAPKSRRQYIGMISKGKKMIWINCFPHKPLKGVDAFSNWTREIVDVSDGGASFWGAVYDVEKHSFERLIVNGSA